MPGCACPTRELLTLLAAVALATLAAAPAGAKIIEIGQTAQPSAPSCPSNPCQAVSRTTGYQAKVGTQAQADGRARRRQDRRLDDHARLARASARSSSSTTTTAAPRRRGSRSSSPARSCVHKVNGHSPLQRLQPYFGTTVQFPLDRSLTVGRAT